MRIFVTGATGFLGSAIVIELVAQGYQVLGLARSRQGVEMLGRLGAEALLGDINDFSCLLRGVEQADGVIHTAFNHDFSTFAANCEQDRQVIIAIGLALKNRCPFIVTSIASMGGLVAGEMAYEENLNIHSLNPRKASELAVTELVNQGVNVSVIRLPQVHNRVKQGLITEVKKLAQQKGVSAYIGQGDNRWAAVHLSDAARLYVLALQRQMPGARYHAVAEQGIAFKEIATALGRELHLPVKSLPSEQSVAHFGWLSQFVNHDMSASSQQTQLLLDWQCFGPGLIADLSPRQKR